MNVAIRITLSNGEEAWLRTEEVEVEEVPDAFGQPMSLDVRFLAQTGSWIENLLKINESVKVSQLLLMVDNDRKIQIDFRRYALGVIMCRSCNLNSTSDISIMGAGVATELKGEIVRVNKKFSTKIVSIKFPDERGRYTGKTYNYFLHEELPLPNLSDRIQIKSIKGFGDVVPQKPHYEDRSVLVVGAFNVTADTVEEYADKILTYGDCLKTIYNYEITSSIVSDVVQQEKEATLSIQVDDHEKLWQDLNNVVANIPYGFTLSAVNNEQVKFNSENLCLYTKNDSGGWDLRAELKPYGKEDTVRNKYVDEWDSLVSAGAIPTYSEFEEMVVPKKQETVSFEKKKEKKSMKNIFGNIMKNVKFGQLNTDKVAYSMQGMAFKSSEGDYLVYKKDQPAVNVNEFVIEMPLFVMPVPLKELQVGDIICKGEDFVLVDSIGESYITAINTDKSEIVTIVPQVNMFGFSFYSKVVAPTNLFGEATQDNPFGNILPLMMLGDEDGDSSVFGMMMLMNQMNGGKGMNMDFAKMAPLFLLGNQDGKDDTFKMMALMSMMNSGFEKKE